MYACIRKTGGGIFEGVCAFSSMTAHLCDPPPSHDSRKLTPANASRSQRDRAGRVGRLPRPLAKVYGSGHKFVNVVVVALINAVYVLYPSAP